ncbi:MAG: TIGR03087 family PEP-CTERM/XrtA system glycosyltransferase [Pseudomonadota bacterium]
MTVKREILFLAHRIPYPPNKGDKIRSWRMLKHLAERFDVHLAAFVDDEKDFQHKEFLTSMCKSAVLAPLDPKHARIRSLRGLMSGAPLSFPYYSDARMRAAIDEIRARPLTAEVVFSSAMAPYIASPRGERARIVDLCDADSEKWRQYAGETGFPMNLVYRREAEKLAAAENDIVRWADKSFAISEAEAAIFNDRHAPGDPRVDWWSNGVDTDYFSPQAQTDAIDTSPDVVFVGAMDYRANVDAVLYFCDEVWPGVRAALPEATFAIVGANPEERVVALGARAGVTVTGRVDDVRPWIAASKLAVAPMRIARGVQNKVLEAMAMARPVVATRAAMTGVFHTPGRDAIVEDAPDAMAGAITGLLQDAEARIKLGAAARARILADYQWSDVIARFDAALPE